MTKINVHIVSDSTGEMSEHLANTTMKQFSDLEPEYFYHTLIRNKEKLDSTMEDIRTNPGIVFSTLVQKNQKDEIDALCVELNIPNIDAVDMSTKLVSFYTGSNNYNYGTNKAKFGLQYKINDEYNSKIEAIQWTMQHDDGQALDTITDADIILLGVSRTSKTPTSIYLGMKGYKVGNIPMVKGISLDQNVLDYYLTNRKPFIIGLTISPERLVDIRTNRVKNLSNDSNFTLDNYTDIESIKEELLEIRRFFTKYEIPAIDVTRTSVEETSAKIIEISGLHT